MDLFTDLSDCLSFYRACGVQPPMTYPRGGPLAKFFLKIYLYDFQPAARNYDGTSTELASIRRSWRNKVDAGKIC